MPRDFILALDQGTTSSRALVFDREGNIHAIAQKEFPQYFPKNGWVEHDPEEIWESQYSVALAAIERARLTKEDIAAIGISNQRETTILWEKESGRAVRNAIVWQDRRTAQICKKLKDSGYESLFTERTGLRLDPYFSGTKIKWLLENVPEAASRAASGELAFGTVDTWLTHKLTSGHAHVTDITNASRTLLYNISQRKWDQKLLGVLDIPEAILPAVHNSGFQFGECRVEGLEGIPITGIAGDQQAALFGQACFDNGSAKNTYGTGCFLLRPCEQNIQSKHDLLTTIACGAGPEKKYALEGSVFSGGAVIQWLRDQMGLIKESTESEALARSVEDNGGIYLVPAFSGLGAPHWDPNARGTICGLTRATSAAHIVRAALESIAFQSADLLQGMTSDLGAELSELRVDGGASKNNFLMQFQADIMGIPVIRPKVTETTALGAACLAGITIGLWPKESALGRERMIDRVFEPSMLPERIEELRGRWTAAVERSKNWVD